MTVAVELAPEAALKDARSLTVSRWWRRSAAAPALDAVSLIVTCSARAIVWR